MTGRGTQRNVKELQNEFNAGGPFKMNKTK